MLFLKDQLKYFFTVDFNLNKPRRVANQSDVLLLACEPIKNVRIAFIGLGKRGKQSFKHFMYMNGVEIVAVCDLFEENIAEIQQILLNYNKEKAQAYVGENDWKLICERSDIDLLYVCTDRNLHTTIAVYGMQCGKHVAIEVPAANTIEECWKLVDTAEQTRRHCIMLENCCYDAPELTFLNMSQQALFGEVFHAEGAYIHDLKSLDFERKKHYALLWSMQGNPYPTHGFGPLCQVMNIHRGDRLKQLVSVSSGQFNYPENISNELQLQFQLGNINTTIVSTERNKTIVLQHDISSPRPYTRNYLISGTKGFVQKREEIKVAFGSNPNECLNSDELQIIMEKYEHPFYHEIGELARKVGAHGGMDFVMDYRLIYCLQNGLALDMDVYDAAEWSCIVELSAESVKSGSQPIQIPDFTRGEWNKLKKLEFSRK